MIEVEIKLPVKNIRRIESDLTEMGFVRGSRIREKDFYFDNDDGRIRSEGEALRIRQDTDLDTGIEKTMVTYKEKKLNKQSMTRRELETGVENAEIFIQILNSLGFKIIPPEVVKIRRFLKLGDVNACLDEVEGLGDFLELEIMIPKSENYSQALSRIEIILKKLGYSLKDTTGNSYLSMLQHVED